MIRFSVLGKPQPKQRPRKGRSGFYTPKKTADYERRVVLSFLEKSRGKTLWKGNVGGSIIFNVSDMKKDIDNLAKSILDGLNGIAYLDDSQVVHLELRKILVEKGQECSICAFKEEQ